MLLRPFDHKFHTIFFFTSFFWFEFLFSFFFRDLRSYPSADTTLTEWHEQGPVWTLNSVDRHHMYCVVVVHISYDNRLRTGRYEVTTQRQCAHCRAALEQTPRGVTEKTTGGVWLSVTPSSSSTSSLPTSPRRTWDSYKYRLLAPCPCLS